MILEKMFNGELYVAEQVVPQNPEYNKENRLVSDLMTDLSERLSEDDFAVIKELRSHLSNSQCIENETFFKYGFAVGVELMQEVYEFLDQYRKE